MDFSYTAVFNDEGFRLIKHYISSETMVVVRGEVKRCQALSGASVRYYITPTGRYSVFQPNPLINSFTHHSPAHSESSLALKTLYIVLTQHYSSLRTGRVNVKQCTCHRIVSRISRYCWHLDLTYTLSPCAKSTSATRSALNITSE